MVFMYQLLCRYVIYSQKVQDKLLQALVGLKILQEPKSELQCNVV